MVLRGGTLIAYRRLQYVFRHAVMKPGAQTSKNSDAWDKMKTDVRFCERE